MAKHGCLPIPNIDLGARFQVIDDSGVGTPRWKTLERAFATKAHAQRIIKKYHLQGIWMLDDCGYREYINKHGT